MLSRIFIPVSRNHCWAGNRGLLDVFLRYKGLKRSFGLIRVEKFAKKRISSGLSTSNPVFLSGTSGFLSNFAILNEKSSRLIYLNIRK